ncbi:glycosyltransferase family 2 protein [Rhizobium sp. RU36D]|uniref:glycosyltransferase family 2 protein n=1 Tax=Rhizobium sp. RU36D TaxID=1907415 RepID=UPI0009D7CA1A|nr:glycosyltransferase family 2 protein [Rhizobium sp. RU36D]SMD15972.1 putative glycosyltransferase [Rhizobium sp. RU36D]
MKLSIVATLYRSAPYISEFYERVTKVAHAFAGDDYEIVLVNDGSPDDSLERAVELSQADPHVLVVDLSRNFGHHKAMMAGLEYSNGAYVFLIDSDLEEQPEWLETFAEMMHDKQCDVVFGEQVSRKGGWFERVSGEIFYAVFNFLSAINHPRNITTARLMTRRYVDSLLQHREREMVISCLWIITGYRQIALPVVKEATSPSTYNFVRKMAYVVNAVTSFSAMPLYMIFYCGIGIFISALLYAFSLLVLRLTSINYVEGWTSVMVSVWLLGGLIISFIGIIGIYLAGVFSETKQRPYFIVRTVYGARR